MTKLSVIIALWIVLLIYVAFRTLETKPKRMSLLFRKYYRRKHFALCANHSKKVLKPGQLALVSSKRCQECNK